MAEKTPFQLLEEKMVPEIENGYPYEALQLAESFIARKKKVVGRDITAQLVFYGAKLLIKGNASSDAGTLLIWYMEDGAGDDYYFRVNNDTKQVDLDLLIDLFNTHTPAQSHPVLSKIYMPFHRLIMKTNPSSQSISKQTMSILHKIELKWIDIFIDQKDFAIACKALMRIGEDIPRIAKVLDLWAREGGGYASEYPLYFARSILTWLADGRVSKAESLLKASVKYVEPYEAAAIKLSTDNVDVAAKERPQTGSEGALAIWHMAIILTELAAMEPKPRVDKSRIFNLVLERYNATVMRIDPRLVQLYDKMAQNAFEINVNGNQGGNGGNTNPMAAMLQNMLAGGAGGASAASGQPAAAAAGGQPPLDMNAMMKMLQQMNPNA